MEDGIYGYVQGVDGSITYDETHHASPKVDIFLGGIRVTLQHGIRELYKYSCSNIESEINEEARRFTMFITYLTQFSLMDRVMKTHFPRSGDIMKQVEVIYGNVENLGALVLKQLETELNNDSDQLKWKRVSQRYEKNISDLESMIRDCHEEISKLRICNRKFMIEISELKDSKEDKIKEIS